MFGGEARPSEYGKRGYGCGADRFSSAFLILLVAVFEGSSSKAPHLWWGSRTPSPLQKTTKTAMITFPGPPKAWFQQALLVRGPCARGQFRS